METTKLLTYKVNKVGNNNYFNHTFFQANKILEVIIFVNYYLSLWQNKLQILSVLVIQYNYHKQQN